MNSRIDRNKQFLTDLYGGPYRGHAIIMDSLRTEISGHEGDFAISDKPLSYWVPRLIEDYEAMVKWHQAIDDDSVPFVKLSTGTEVFAAAFGCKAHVFDDSPPCALPFIENASDADRLVVPGLDARSLSRIFEMGELIKEQVGNDVCIGVPDIQSPFDIANLIWNKEDLFIALHEEPEAVKRLVDKCNELLKAFLDEFKRRFPNCNLCHCPNAWAPPELGCWLSEDEVGCLSASMFEEFCLPVLSDLSEEYGGLSMHCCANADHQYGGFRKIPNLRGLNRVFQEPGAGPAVKTFAGNTVLVLAWYDENTMCKIVDMALPESRFLINIPAQTLDESKRTFDRMRRLYPRI